SGLPLPLTDGVIGPDGAMYFLTGGRRIDSDLYRVYHRKYESLDTNPTGDNQITAENALRRQLEGFHQETGQEAIDFAWPYLNHEDRFVRYAARIAVEHQPVDLWATKVINEEEPQILIQGAIALARNGKDNLRDELLNALLQVDFDGLGENLQVDFTRAVELIMYRMGIPSSDLKIRWAQYFDPHFPSTSSELNRQLSKILVAVEAPVMIEKALDLLESAEVEDNMDYISSPDLVLRNPQYGLTIGRML